MKNWIPAIIVMLIIFGLSSMPGETVDAVGLDDAVTQINGHFFIFTILCITYYKAIKNIPLSIVLTVIYAALDEFHQTFTMWRNPSLFDIKVDTAGAILAAIILWKLQHILPEKLRNWLNN